MRIIDTPNTDQRLREVLGTFAEMQADLDRQTAALRRDSRRDTLAPMRGTFHR